MIHATPETIGDVFATILRTWLTKYEWSAMQQANAAEQDPQVCHSHDYCDANMAMQAAFDTLGISTDDIGENEELCKLWNAAWEHAAKTHLGRPS